MELTSSPTRPTRSGPWILLSNSVLALLLAVLASSGAAFLHAQASQESARPKLADFTWLAGTWQGGWGPRLAQQNWTAPRAGVMTGTMQVTGNGRPLVIELFTLTDGPGGVELRIRRFTASLTAWSGNEPSVLRLVSNDAAGAAFENVGAGEPHRQTFRRVDADDYSSRSEMPAVPNRDKSDEQVVEINFHRTVDVVSPKRKAK